MNGQPMFQSGFSITEAQRRELDAAIADYRDRLEPRPNNHRGLAVVLAKLLAAFPAPVQSDAPVEQRMDAYFEALHDVPAWAADEARKMVVGGRVTDLNPAWAPTPPQFARIARQVMRPDQIILADMERIAAAKTMQEIDQGERERVADGWQRVGMAMALPKTL